jgi:hypothetical protein
MTLSPLFFWAAGFLIVALAGLFISAKIIKIDIEKNGELIVAMLTILGTLVSVLLGLLVSSADEQYRALEESVNNEATCINEVFRLSCGVPPATARILQDGCIDYCDKVIKEEWPAMSRGEMSMAVNEVFTELSDTIVRFHPSNDGEAAVQGSLLSGISEVGHNRGTRIVASRGTWTVRLLPLIMTCAIVVLACSYLYVAKGSMLLHSVLVGLVAITLGTNVGVIFLMTRPFASEWAIQPESFELRSNLMKEYRKRFESTEIHDQSTSKAKQ